MRSFLLALSLTVAACGPSPQPAPRAFAALAPVAATDYGGYRPHYQGYGVNTPGGRGGVVLKVTNLNDAGVGSLRAALAPATCTARFIVFETSGTIPLASPIFATCPFLTLAGQTAPSPGVTVRNFAVYIDTHDVVLQHVRFRRGDTNPTSEDVLYLRNGVYNVVLDHLSVSWGTHGLVDINAWTGAQAHDVAILDTVMSEGLKKSSTDPAANVPFGTATVVMPSQDGTLTIARNLFAHQGNRNPWLSSGNRVSGYNNLAYDAAGVAGDEGMLGFLQVVGNGYPNWPFEVAWISNLAIPGVDTHADTKPIKIDLSAAQTTLGYQLYLSDNVGPFQTPSTQWAGVTYHTAATEASVRINTVPPWHAAFNYVIMPSDGTQAYVLAHVGARPLDRDPVDTRIVNDVTSRTGASITTPADVGGFPTLAANARPYQVPTNPNAVAPGQAFRTNIEMDLETFAQALESSAVIPPVPTACPTGFIEKALIVREAITLQVATIYTCVKTP